LTGLGFGVEPTGRHNDGCFMAVFKVDAFRPLAEFKREIGAFIQYLKETPPPKGRAACSTPARSSTSASRTAARTASRVEDSTWDKIKSLAEGYGLARQLAL